MRSILLVCVLSLGVFNANAIEKKIKRSAVPAAVKAAFEQKYPGKEVEKWELENGNYEAEFDKIGDIDYEAVFTADGKWIMTTTEIKKKNVPQKIKDAVTNGEFKGWRMEEVEEGDMPGYDKIYVVEVEKGKEEFIAYYDGEGKFIKKEVNKE